MRTLTVDDNAFASKPDLRTAGREPSHARIEQWLAGMIADGALSTGDKLPPEGELAAAVGVSRMTLRQSLAALEQRELLERRRGRGGGTFVARPRIECDLTGLPGFTEQMRRAHVRAGARMVTARARPAPPEVSAALKLPAASEVYEIVRVRLADREPLALEETYLSAEAFPGLLERRLTGSLYSLMRRAYRLAPHSAREWLEPVVATDEQARLLEAATGAPLMLVTRTAYTESGMPVEFAYDRYRADRTRIALRTSIAGPAAVEPFRVEIRR
ncbi:GntR family transcriptional regulator [Solicola gregarius]|uniref:GntR family transcriptional regulator n=1 Tax=Solicola gregarius TaxID=2908642 RepID=A0AA46TLV8_9ACTN|nr:GntR family transcriptional regulator [Solicola gregarius]UYM07322.1 GntR family transcriptional regulator [Solicola gregarius]